MTLARAFLIFNGIVFGSYGVLCLVDPSTVTDFTDMQLPTITATIEARAMYGGLQLTMGLLLLYCARQTPLIAHGLVVAIFIFAGLAGARAIGLAIDGGDSNYNLAATAYESICGVIAVLLLRNAGQSSTPDTTAET